MRKTSFTILSVVLSVVFEGIGSVVNIVVSTLSMIFMSVQRVRSASA